VVSEQERGGMIDYLYDYRLCSYPHSLEILASDKITIHEPSLNGIIASDRLHLAAMVDDVDSIVKYAKAMKAAFEKNPLPKETTTARLQIRAATYLSQCRKLDEAMELLPESLPVGIDDIFKQRYEKILKDIKLKKSRVKKLRQSDKNLEKGKKK